MPFLDRRHAGHLVAQHLAGHKFERPLVFALASGGVPLGFEVARQLHAPLEVLVIGKLTTSLHPEFGIGALAEDGHYWIDKKNAKAIGATALEIEKCLQREEAEMERKIKLFRHGQALPSVKGRLVILVDDGLATGVSAKVACHFLKRSGAQKVVLAVPVCSPKAIEGLSAEFDQVICLERPPFFYHVGQFYREFEEPSDEAVMSLLKESRDPQKNSPALPKPAHFFQPGQEEVELSVKGASLRGLLTVPAMPQGIVIFANSSSNGRTGPRNQQVAKTLGQAGIATLSMDLLTEKETEDASYIFDITLLSSRLMVAVNFIREKMGEDLPLGLFAVSTGAGAALTVAAELKEKVQAVVCRGGRPDLALSSLPEVTAPVLFIVGGNDTRLIQVNSECMRFIKRAKLILVNGAGHLFEELGTLEAVSQHAQIWFDQFLDLRRQGKAA